MPMKTPVRGFHRTILDLGFELDSVNPITSGETIHVFEMCTRRVVSGKIEGFMITPYFVVRDEIRESLGPEALHSIAAAEEHYGIKNLYVNYISRESKRKR